MVEKATTATATTTTIKSNQATKVRLATRQNPVMAETMQTVAKVATEKVAAKVYVMKALFVLGKKYDWVHDELKTIISQDYSNHTAAYQAATRNLLKKLNK